MTPKRILLALALGPISGPLALLAYNAWRRGHRFQAVFYASGITLFYVTAPTLLVYLHEVQTHAHP